MLSENEFSLNFVQITMSNNFKRLLNKARQSKFKWLLVLNVLLKIINVGEKEVINSWKSYLSLNA